MTPKEKAKELVDKFSKLVRYAYPKDAVESAKIAVDEIIETFIDIDPKLSFWQEVKKELENY